MVGPTTGVVINQAAQSIPVQQATRYSPGSEEQVVERLQRATEPSCNGACGSRSSGGSARLLEYEVAAPPGRCAS